MNDAALKAAETYMNNLGKQAHHRGDVPTSVLASAVAAVAGHISDEGGNHPALASQVLTIAVQAVGAGLIERAKTEGGEEFLARELARLTQAFIGAMGVMLELNVTMATHVVKAQEREPVH